jgi:heme oxygenase
VPSAALALIRASTEVVHRELETSLDVARSEADDGAYTRYVEAMLGCVGLLERELWAGPWPEQIAPHERATPHRPASRPLPTRWLAGYGPECGEKWRTFLATLEGALAELRQAEIAAASARETFEMVRQWLSLRGVA